MNLSFDKDILGPWICQRIGKVWGPEGRECVGLVDGDIILGGFLFEDFSGRSIVIHVAIEHPHVPLRRMMAAAAGYAYNQLGVHKVIAPVASTNEKSVRFTLRAGFKPEAIIKDAVVGGDILIFSMTAEQCGYVPKVKEVA